MQEVDKHFALIPWKEEDASRPNIKELEKIPTMMSQLRVYLTRAQAKTAGGGGVCGCLRSTFYPD